MMAVTCKYNFSFRFFFVEVLQLLKASPIFWTFTLYAVVSEDYKRALIPLAAI